MKKIIPTLAIAFISSFNYAQDSLVVQRIDFEKIKEIDTKTYDLFYQEHWFDEDEAVKNSIYLDKDKIVKYSDQEIVELLELIPTEFTLSYNNVIKSNIEFFSERRRKTVAQSLGLGEHYFPYFEEVLSKHNVPLVFKYLPVIESNMNPFAGSHMGATGMWQFMLRTGQHFGLDVNDYFDERRNPYLATEAAATYLSELYEIYGDWQLVLAAYNAGPGNVNKAIGISGGKTNFWEIRPYLPVETQNYVPKFIACLFVMYYHENYGILPEKPSQELFLTEPFIVKRKTSLKYICELTGMDSTYMHFINPALTTGIIPYYENGFELNIPLNYLTHFSAIEAFLENDPYVAKLSIDIVKETSPKYITYTVRSGNTLGHIAQRYNTTVSKIKKWNRLSSDNLRIGQKLRIYN